MLPVVLFAKPADRRVRNVKQSDGTVLKVILSGDEFFHYYCLNFCEKSLLPSSLSLRRDKA